ncbi:MAG: acetylglutamate kinase [Verrucomicrobia bacterium]|nr:acetylglutamate kinase [Verrucomicrobiota bacterium]MDA1006720.1 acetylglutamate kinase [Verrucomicrobiota bacterium]
MPSIPTTKAATLIEALPYLQRYRGKTFLIKMGGSAMENPELVSDVMRDITFLEIAGINPIIVHGGGKAISAAMTNAGLEAKFVGGLRVTTPQAIAIVEKTLAKSINPQLVNLINQHGGRATGIPGTGVFQARRILATDDQGQPADIGRVGEVESCLTDDILYATSSNIVPVLTPLGSEIGTGKTLNVNADLAAAALACTLKPTKLVYISDVPGLLRDPKDPTTLIPTLTRTEAEAYMADGTISGGMIPKVRSALDALDAGVGKVHFIDGRVPHTLLLEIFTKQGSGTQIIK